MPHASQRSRHTCGAQARLRRVNVAQTARYGAQGVAMLHDDSIGSRDGCPTGSQPGAAVPHASQASLHTCGAQASRSLRREAAASDFAKPTLLWRVNVAKPTSLKLRGSKELRGPRGGCATCNVVGSRDPSILLRTGGGPTIPRARAPMLQNPSRASAVRAKGAQAACCGA